MTLDMTVDNSNPPFSSEEIKQLAEQIGEIMHEGGELSLLESKMDSRMLETVSRCLNRMEDRPELIREVEAVLMNLNEPTLSVAILQQAFLVRSDHVLASVVNQLNRLAQSTDLKTAKLSLNALKEAANSEIPRLQNIGCRALFTSGKLSPEELLRFAQSENLDFSYRIDSVKALLVRQSDLGPKAFLFLAHYWDDEMSDDQKRSFKNNLFELAKSMDLYETLDRSLVESIIERLFAAADTQAQSTDYKKILQMAMASLPQHTIDYTQKLGLDRRMTAIVVFTLITCAKKTPQATAALIELAEEAIRVTGFSNLWILNRIGQRLENAKNEGLLPKLEALISLASEVAEKVEDKEFIYYLLATQKCWKTGKSDLDLMGNLNKFAEEFEVYPVLEERDAKQIRFLFEKRYKQLRFDTVTSSERAVLFEAMQMTAESMPWFFSESYLRTNYDTFAESERLATLDVCGCVAQGEAKSLTKSPKLCEMRGFFEKVARNGTYAESQKARQWLEKLTGEVLPE